MNIRGISHLLHHSAKSKSKKCCFWYKWHSPGLNWKLFKYIHMGKLVTLITRCVLKNEKFTCSVSVPPQVWSLTDHGVMSGGGSYNGRHVSPLWLRSLIECAMWFFPLGWWNARLKLVLKCAKIESKSFYCLFSHYSCLKLCCNALHDLHDDLFFFPLSHTD